MASHKYFDCDMKPLTNPIKYNTKRNKHDKEKSLYPKCSYQTS